MHCRLIINYSGDTTFGWVQSFWVSVKHFHRRCQCAWRSMLCTSLAVVLESSFIHFPWTDFRRSVNQESSGGIGLHPHTLIKIPSPPWECNAQNVLSRDYLRRRIIWEHLDRGVQDKSSVLTLLRISRRLHLRWECSNQLESVIWLGTNQNEITIKYWKYYQDMGAKPSCFSVIETR